MSEESMIERVARAICCPEGCRGDTGSGKPCDIGAEDATAMVQARAAIEAMRMPTANMVLAVTKEEKRRGFFSHEAMDADDAWPIMIDAALKEGKE